MTQQSTQQIGPCSNWADTEDFCAPCNDYAVDPDTFDTFLESASHILFFATAQQFRGECEVTVAPCSCNSFPATDWTVSNGVLTLAPFAYFNACGCRRTSSCSCTHLSTIDLPFTPATAVTEVVTSDGTIPEASYELRSQSLVRIDGESWPLCDDEFRVTMTYGIPVPTLLRRAAAILACELYMGCHPDEFDGQCRLPRNVVSLTRQGVSVVMESAFWTARPGRHIEFGIPEIDTAIATYNPHGLMAPSAIFSPDDPDLARLVNP